MSYLTESVTVDEAAAICARHQLRLDDVIALRMLARDAEHAEKLAALFQPTPKENQ